MNCLLYSSQGSLTWAAATSLESEQPWVQGWTVLGLRRICQQLSPCRGAFLVAQLVKNPPAVQETPVGFLGWDNVLEKG